MGMTWYQILTISLVFGTIAFLLLILFELSGEPLGVFGIILLTFLFAFVQWYIGPFVVKLMTGAQQMDRVKYAKIYQMVERLSESAGLPKVPELYIVNDMSPNAFAFGRTKSSSAIGIHVGLLNILNEDELEGVLAHEIGHIANSDNVLMTFASVIPILLYYFAYFFLLGRDDRDGRGGNILFAWIGAIFARFIGSLLVLALSRFREYVADEFAARLTTKPEALASALAKITYAVSLNPSLIKGSNDAMRAFYIADPSSQELAGLSRVARTGELDVRALAEAMEKESKRTPWLLEALWTHPPTYKRIKRLLSLNI